MQLCHVEPIKLALAVDDAFTLRQCCCVFRLHFGNIMRTTFMRKQVEAHLYMAKVCMCRAQVQESMLAVSFAAVIAWHSKGCLLGLTACNTLQEHVSWHI